MENKKIEFKTKFDTEYETSFYDEVLWLRSHGIRYDWVYVDHEGYSVWKYLKTPQLWECLSQMYKNVKYQKGATDK